MVGDSSPQEARRVIQDDCFGTLLYATTGLFDRRFVREVEIPAAIEVKTRDPKYVLTAFLRGLPFGTLREKSQSNFGIDLSEFHCIASHRLASPAQRHSDWSRMALEVLRKWLALQPVKQAVSLQFSTRQLFPDSLDDVLRIDATDWIAGNPLDMDKWDAVRLSLTDVQTELTVRFGRPRISVHGSKHLTAAFLFGRVFSRNILDIRQTATEVWSSDTTPTAVEPFEAAFCVPDGHDRSVFVEIASGLKNVAGGVDDLIHKSASANPSRLSLIPTGGPLSVDNPLCMAMVRHAYQEIERAIAKTGARSIHLFVAAPQSFMMMLAQRFAGMPEAHLYEWDNGRYVKSCVVPAGPAGAF